MPFLILLLLALGFFLFITLRLWRRPGMWRYVVLLLIVDGWLGIVLFYLLYSALFD
jgi:nucleoside recognition membrane protein YjiH